MADLAAYQLRSASPEDAGALARLSEWQAAGGRDPEKWQSWLADPATITLVADVSGPDFIAFLDVRRAADEAEIVDLWVAPSLRRSGVAGALLERLASDLAGCGIARLFLEVAVDNEPACALYRKQAFEIVARRKVYYTRPSGEYVDAHVMVHRIASGTDR